MDRTSGADDEVPVRMVSVHPPGTGPTSWFPDGFRPIAEGSEVELFATDVPDFERELPLLRADGTVQAYVAVTEPLPDLGDSGACDGDGD